MAQIEQSDGGKKKKGAQKKMHIHVDFTPMVDMNMLLITFFMLCTTMIKSQTLSITLPSNEPTEENEKTEAKESEGITLIVDVARDAQGNAIKDANGKPVKNVVYYYFGKPWDGVNGPNPVKQEEFIGDENHLQRGIRKILHDRNKEVLRQVDELKTKWKDGGFSKNKAANDSLYQEAAKKVRNDESLERPVVVIKATPEATWESLISALDEMQINQIARYQIDQITDADKYMMINYLATHPSK